MAALDTVQNYTDQARFMLQDEQTGAYRYSDAVIVRHLNMGIIEAARIRPDLFFIALRAGTVPEYSAASMATSVVFPLQYQPALLDYIVGMTQLSDNEDMQDSRAAALLKLFLGKLTTVAA